MNRYLSLFRENLIFRRLAIIQLLNYIGGWLVTTAIFTLLIHLDADPFWIGLIGASMFLAGVLQAPFVGVINDRVEPKKIFITLILVEITTTFFLLFIDSAELIPFVFILVFLRMGSASFYFNLEMTILPKIVKKDQLQSANELHSISWSFTYALGTALGGVAVYFFGVQTALIIDISLYLISFVLLLGTSLKVEREVQEEDFFSMLKSGFYYLKNHKKLIHLIILHGFVGLATYESVIALASEEFFMTVVSVAMGIGFTHSIRALAITIGPMLLNKIVNKNSMFYLFWIQGIFVIIWAFLIEDFYLNLIGAFLSGFIISSLWAFTYTLIQTETEPKYYGRVIAYNDIFFLAIASLSAFLSAESLNFGFSIFSVIFTIGILFIFGGFYTLYLFNFKEKRELKN